MTVVDERAVGPAGLRRWVDACALADLVPDRGVRALVAGRAVAVFRCSPDDDGLAIDDHDPFTGASVLSRGLVGSVGERPWWRRRCTSTASTCAPARALDDPAVPSTPGPGAGGRSPARVDDRPPPSQPASSTGEIAAETRPRKHCPAARIRPRHERRAPCRLHGRASPPTAAGTSRSSCSSAAGPGSSTAPPSAPSPWVTRTACRTRHRGAHRRSPDLRGVHHRPRRAQLARRGREPRPGRRAARRRCARPWSWPAAPRRRGGDDRGDRRRLVHPDAAQPRARGPPGRAGGRRRLPVAAGHDRPRVAVQLDGSPDEWMGAAVAALGFDVVAVPVYRWELPEDRGPARRVMQGVIDGSIDAVTFTAAHAVTNFFTIAEEVGVVDEVLGPPSPSARPRRSCVGPVCADRVPGFGVEAHHRAGDAPRSAPWCGPSPATFAERRRALTLGGHAVTLQGRMARGRRGRAGPALRP